ncbi:RidA family protein [Pelagibacterium sp. H642]|uniref:RidA family protein n=1 Tax=Pelagibacterium sp. H642 TaxID=1881069 RepID=UPI0028167773|nr:RidA family protein [Pelagibacterium sp. H642]WMT92058.1 RidA family protein [Pelagibacterium sp. H642]
MTPYQRLAELGLELPPVPEPVANFTNWVREGDLVFISGQGPVEPDGTRHTGKLGAGVDSEAAYAHARLTGLNLIAVMHEALGDLSRVKRVVKLLGMVNATPDFIEHPKVVNGCSDLMVAVFGKKGIHARSAVGFSSLPFGITVEIEAVIAVED